MKKQVERKKQSIVEANKVFKELCHKVEGYGIDHITSKRRDNPLVDARQKIAIAMREMGYTYPVIGHVMNRDHTSIIYLVKHRKKSY